MPARKTVEEQLLDQNPAQASTEEEEEKTPPKVFVGGWTETFDTKAGQILHTPTMVQMGGMTSGAGLYISYKMFNGVPMLAPLDLHTNSSREDFLAALVVSGLK